MQIDPETDVAELFQRLVEGQGPGRRGMEAWRSMLRAHATLMRQLEMDLERETGLALADFDVLAQVALAGGELRMTELAARVLISRSGMTRRVGRLVDEGLVRRGAAGSDGRGVVVALTDADVADDAGVDLAGGLVRVRRADRCRNIRQGISAARLDHGRGVAVDGVVFRPAGVAGVSALGAPEQPALPAGDW